MKIKAPINIAHRLLVFLLCSLLSPIALAECHLVVNKAALNTSANSDTYSTPKAYIDQLTCIDIEKFQDQQARIKALEAALLKYRGLSDKLANNLEDYRSVNTDLNNTLDRSVTLTKKYDQQLLKYDQLSGEFNQLTHRYDKLIDEYRDIALNRHSFISLDAGVGFDENGDVMGLIGAGFKNFRAWGIAQQDNNGLIVGGSLPF
ncbi:MAG: hypothetical protein MI976_03420 [Pseudomonadales bacterium]|nr:hypothetical protein [Pseudomonadales bacterium]